jgi:hypothetical protein
MRFTGSLLLLIALAACISTGVAAAAPQPIEDDGGSSWRLEQPPPPPPPPGVQASPTPVGLGKIGDIEFWAPNRGLLTTAGNGSTVPAGLWAYNGIAWHELSTVCGASDGRIAWAGPDDFWTISDGRPGQAADALGNPAPLQDNTLCHFQNGRVVASYGSLAFRADSYQAMDAAGCIDASDCWFAGAPLPAPQVGTFQLHWDGTSLTREPYTQDSDPITDFNAFAGALSESVELTAPIGEEPAGLRLVNPKGVSPQFETLPGLPLYGGEEFPNALEPFHLASGEGALWGAAGGVPEQNTPPGSDPGQLTVVRYDGESWHQLLGASSEPSSVAGLAGEAVTSIAAESGSEAAWLALDTQTDAVQPSPVAPAHVVRIAADGTISTEDDQLLPAQEEGVGPKGGAAKIACPAPHDCWLASTQGWLYHLTNGQEGLSPDGDPSFAGPITERPADEGVPQVQPDAPPPDDSGLLGEPPPSLGTLPENAKEPEARVHVPLLSRIHSRVVHGSTLELSFHLAVKARIRLIARRKRTVVASTPRRVLRAGRQRLLLRLDPHRWPTKLQLQTHALAALPTVPAGGGGGGSQTVSTSLITLRRFPQLTHFGLLP